LKNKNSSGNTLFICPECGSKKLGVLIWGSTESNIDDDPWNNIFDRIQCVDCKYTIPGYLGKREEGMSESQAKKEWLEKYRTRSLDQS